MKITETISNFYKYAPTKSRIVVSLGFLGLLAIIIISVIGIILKNFKPVEDTHITLTNPSIIANVPLSHQTAILKSIWSAIDSDNDFSGIIYEDAAIRDNSYTETISNGITTANFIIDIESLHYSFAVLAHWSNNSSSDPDVHISCPHYLDVIYTNTKCVAQSPLDQLRRYLPHYENLSNGELYDVKLRTYDNFQAHAGEQYLAISAKACGNSAILDEALSNTKAWLKSIYLDPNDYYLEPIDSCYSL